MTETFFISDTHFGHKNILEYEKDARPFKTVEEMNECIIERWNSVVKPKDIVYHLGDFAFGKHNISIAEHLNGDKRLIIGNHDIYPTVEYLKYFSKLYGVLFWKRCILSHVPVHPSGIGNRYMLNVHGHTHSKVVREITCNCDVWKNPQEASSVIYNEINPDIRYFNVSCEQNNLTPIHRDIIMERLKEIEVVQPRFK